MKVSVGPAQQRALCYLLKKEPLITSKLTPLLEVLQGKGLVVITGLNGRRTLRTGRIVYSTWQVELTDVGRVLARKADT